MLEKTKNTKILVRLTKKAGNETKALAQTIIDNAATASKEKLISPAGGLDSPNSINGNHVLPPMFDPAAGTKRPREPESSNLLTTKRPALPSSLKVIQQASKPLALQNVERRRVESTGFATKGSAALPGANSATISTNTTNAPLKPKVSVVAPPKATNNVFSSLMSASKKPGTSIAARAAAAKEKVRYVNTPMLV